MLASVVLKVWPLGCIVALALACEILDVFLFQEQKIDVSYSTIQILPNEILYSNSKQQQIGFIVMYSAALRSHSGRTHFCF